MKLSVIIVNYNVRPYLTACLDSVQRALEGIESEVFVVDNHSDDDSVEVISRDYAWVHLINNRENLGFSKANNIAIRQAQGEYILLLNPDTVVAEETLKGVIDFMDQHPKAGGAGVRMHNADGTLAPESRRAIPTPFVAARKMLGFTKRYYMSCLSWDAPAQIEVVKGHLRGRHAGRGLFYVWRRYRPVVSSASRRMAELVSALRYCTLQRSVDQQIRFPLCACVLSGHADILPQALQSPQFLFFAAS